MAAVEATGVDQDQQAGVAAGKKKKVGTGRGKGSSKSKSKTSENSGPSDRGAEGSATGRTYTASEERSARALWGLHTIALEMFKPRFEDMDFELENYDQSQMYLLLLKALPGLPAFYCFTVLLRPLTSSDNFSPNPMLLHCTVRFNTVHTNCISNIYIHIYIYICDYYSLVYTHFHTYT